MERNYSVNLRKEIEKANITIATLSKRSGVSMASISQYLSGRCAPSVVNAEKLATVLGCHPITLLGFDFPDQENSISDPLIIEIAEEAKGMTFSQKKHLLQYVRLLKEMKEE